MKISIIGLGWFGLPLAEVLRKKHEVKGSKQSPDAAEVVRQMGIEAHALSLGEIWDATAAAGAALLDAEVLVLNIPPGMRSGGAAADYQNKMRAVAEKYAASEQLQHLVFISSTGVFGESQLVVDEHSLPAPDTASGEVLLWAEHYFAQSFLGRCSVIRPAGLIGPGRHPGRFMAGRSGLKGRLHPVNLVHLDDLVTLTCAVVERAPAALIYHAVAAAHPAKETFYAEAARSMGLPLPHFDENDKSHGKCVEGEWSKQQLGVQFRYDSLEGI